MFSLNVCTVAYKNKSNHSETFKAAVKDFAKKATIKSCTFGFEHQFLFQNILNFLSLYRPCQFSLKNTLFLLNPD